MDDCTNETQPMRTPDTGRMRVTLDTLLKTRGWFGFGSHVKSAKFFFGELRLRLDPEDPTESHPNLFATIRAADEERGLPREFIDAVAKLDGYSYDYQAYADGHPHYTLYISYRV